MLSALLGLLLAWDGYAAPPTETRVEWKGFVDTYYSYDFGRPNQVDRVFLTQAARNNEWNINLAYVEASLQSRRARGRLALQAGTAAQALHQGESNVDPFGGPNLYRFVQEAYVGWQITDGVWADFGVFFSHIGSDDFVTSGNLTYTRTLLSDFSPDLAAGARFTFELAPELTAQLQIVNGWHNIIDTNAGKAIGVQLVWRAAPELSLTYNGFAGNERQASFLYESQRLFQEGIVRWSPFGSDVVDAAFALQYGTQAAVPMAPAIQWGGASLQGRVRLSPRVRIALRGEKFVDAGQAVVSTAADSGLNLTGGSIGLDVDPEPGLLWRTEIRAMINSEPVFPARNGISSGVGFGVMSLSVAF